MKTSLLIAVSLCAAGALAVADDTKKETETRAPMKQQPKSARGDASDLTKPELDTAQVMKITQDAMTHIASAERALARGNKAAAKTALARSEKLLGKLYDTPPMMAVLNELDEAIASVKSGKPELKSLDLAPISATFRTYESYMDPALAAGVEKAQQRAKDDDAKGTEAELRKVRDRVAVELALLPVEEAYVRVLAAQQALQRNEPKMAAKLIRNLPVIVSEVQVSQPLVPVRFKLHAAAEAAEAGNWQQSQKLIREVNQDVQRLEGIAMDAQFKSELVAIGDEVERLGERMQEGTRPQPKQIRQLATRTRDIVETAEQQPVQTEDDAG